MKGVKGSCTETYDLRLLNYDGSDERCYNPDCDADSKLIRQAYVVVQEMYDYFKSPGTEVDEDELYDRVSDLLSDLEEAI
jgi:hypothetical protein|tara:strand:+ start:609 stop:848 length:240 start_codon:yes stop_codon:yes gene_type:complete